MKFAEGIVYDYLEEDGRVKEAIVTDKRLAVTFEEEGDQWHLIATRTDEPVYRGEMTPGNDRDRICTVELAVFKAPSGAVILFGKWISRKTGNSHQFIVRLFP